MSFQTNKGIEYSASGFNAGIQLRSCSEFVTLSDGTCMP
jgi:hypothetical protein